MKILNLKDFNISIEEGLDDRDESYRLLKLAAYLGGKKIGHLKIGWMDADATAKKYGNWLEVARKNGIIIPIWPGNPKDWTNIQKKETLEQLKLYGFVPPKKYDSLDKAFAAVEKAIEKKYTISWQRLLDFWVDKPFVEGAHVDPEYQRKGIARSMYIKANEFLRHKYGFNLWGSELQSKEAQMLWQNLQADGLAIQENNRWRMK